MGIFASKYVFRSNSSDHKPFLSENMHTFIVVRLAAKILARGVCLRCAFLSFLIRPSPVVSFIVCLLIHYVHVIPRMEIYSEYMLFKLISSLMKFNLAKRNVDHTFQCIISTWIFLHCSMGGGGILQLQVLAWGILDFIQTCYGI